MRRIRNARRFLVAFGVTALFACGGDSPGLTDPTGDPTDTPTDTAAANAAARTAATNSLLAQMDEAINAMSTALQNGGVPGSSPPPTQGGASLSATLATTQPPTDAAKCTFDEPTMRHVCPDATEKSGVVISTWFQFLDAAGQPSKLPDSLKTVAIRRFVGKKGTTPTQMTTQAGTVPAQQTIDAVDTLMLTGLTGPATERRLNSRGFRTVKLVPEGQPSVDMEIPTTSENLVFTAPGPAGSPKPPPYPIAGKMTAQVKSKRSDQPPAAAGTTNQVTTFEGKNATLVIKSLNGQLLRTCTWDMTVQAPPVCTVP